MGPTALELCDVPVLPVLLVLVLLLPDVLVDVLVDVVVVEDDCVVLEPELLLGLGMDIPTCDRALDSGACIDDGSEPVAAAAPPPATTAAATPAANFALSNFADIFPIMVFLPIAFLPSRVIPLLTWMLGTARTAADMVATACSRPTSSEACAGALAALTRPAALARLGGASSGCMRPLSNLSTVLSSSGFPNITPFQSPETPIALHFHRIF